jgi:poly-gamma-glutamate synthesis protein (capsule biosynthesis protein)
MIRLCAAGDVILLGAICEQYDAVGASLREYIRKADVRIANMETTISDYDCFGSTYCGGTWLTAPPSILTELDRFGFLYYSIANNHAMDYSYRGLLSTVDALKAHGAGYSGAGSDLTDATRHAVVSAKQERIGIIAVTATCDDAARAGDPHGTIPGRPGVNMLRHSEVFSVNEKQAKALEEIAAITHINGRINNSQRGGYTPITPGVFNIGKLCFSQSSKAGKASIPNADDTKRIRKAIEEAREETDYVLVYLHSHEIRHDTDDEPDCFIEEFAHTCVRAGAAAVICSGTHQIKAVEIFQGVPIFYSIANFIFQSNHIAQLPSDFYEKYGVDFTCGAKEALAVRSANGTRGLQTDISNYLGLVPTLYLDAGRAVKVEIQAIELCFEMGFEMKGLPRKAQGDMLRKIYSRLETLSSPYKTRFRMENDLILLEME